MKKKRREWDEKRVDSMISFRTSVANPCLPQTNQLLAPDLDPPFIRQFQGLPKSKKLATQELQRHLQGGKLRDTAEKANEQQAMLRVQTETLAKHSSGPKTAP
jgi:hypothetical protein